MRDTATLEGQDFEFPVDSQTEDPNWLGLARAAYDSSTDFLNSNYRSQFERNVANFQSKHPPGSKYLSDAYKLRSKIFRPKTRTAARKNEASMAAALFSASDVVVLTAEDVDDPQKRQDAAYWHSVLNYRLRKTIPWFITVVGAFQEASTYGFVCSKQYWEYAESEGESYIIPDPMNPNIPAMDNAGNVIKRPEIVIEKDRPKCRLIEVENIRFDPACDWTDPVNSSPYLIECMPMYVGDVLDRMNSVDEKTGQPEWKKLSKQDILAFGKESEQSDNRFKEKSAESEADHEVSDFETVWVHENIVRYGGKDYVYYTLSTRFLLSEPKLLEEVYLHNIRPFVVGITVIEAHKPLPSSLVELGQTLQAEANDITNQRLDNVKLAMNKRYFVDRGANTDLNALLRGAPGGIILTDDVTGVKEQDTRDVTSSSYQEQNRIDSDFDDIAGIFSTASVQNNRQLGETVGGMELMSQFANKDTEYIIRTFVETWVEPVLRQLVKLEQFYEDDKFIHDLAVRTVAKQESDRANLDGGQLEELAELPVTEPQSVDVMVNVGFGNTSSDQRIKGVVNGIKAVAEMAPWALSKLNAEEVADEIFGALGHKNGKRFFTDFKRPEPQPDPELQLKAQELQLRGQELQFKSQMSQTELQLKREVEQAKLILEREIEFAKIASKENITMAELQAKLGIELEKMNLGVGKMDQDRKVAGANNLTKLAEVERKGEELEFKRQTGRQGI